MILTKKSHGTLRSPISPIYITGQPDRQAEVGVAPMWRGPQLFGCRPGSPISIRLHACGDRPMRFTGVGLPAGLELDSASGELHGRVKQAGTYQIRVRAENAVGIHEQSIHLVIGQAIALTPPMGWNSWNCWGKEIDEEKIRAAALHLVTSGLANHGWTYVNIDDGWQGKRCAKTGSLQPNAKFPDMKGLCDYVHGLGLKVGIYSTPWKTSYAGFPGGSADEPTDHGQEIESLIAGEKFGRRSYHAEDVRQFAEWGIDYLKYDWFPISVAHTEIMSRELRGCGRDIVFSLSNSAPIELAEQWSRLAECWRTTGDIYDCWITPSDPKPWEHSVTEIGFSQDPWAKFAGAGHWNDADMLVVGKLGWGPQLRDSRLTLAERRSHISLWCLLASPMLLGCDLSQLDDETLELLTNDEVLAVNQDAGGIQATLWRRDGLVDCYGKSLADGGFAVGLFNRGDQVVETAVSPTMPGMSGQGRCRDLWAGQLLKPAGEVFPVRLEPHDVMLLKVDQ